MKNNTNFEKIVGDHFGKWAALASFPYIEDQLNNGIKLLYNEENLNNIDRLRSGRNIFIINFPFFFWVENIIRLFVVIGTSDKFRAGPRALQPVGSHTVFIRGPLSIMATGSL